MMRSNVLDDDFDLSSQSATNAPGERASERGDRWHESDAIGSFPVHVPASR